jgi:hypothetical protein
MIAAIVGDARRPARLGIGRVEPFGGTHGLEAVSARCSRDRSSGSSAPPSASASMMADRSGAAHSASACACAGHGRPGAQILAASAGAAGVSSTSAADAGIDQILVERRLVLEIDLANGPCVAL